MTDTWVVGGALRDGLRERPVRDVDLAVSGDAESAARALGDELGGPVFRLSEAFGAWRVLDRERGRVFDFSPLQGPTIEEDLGRRDFTVNAMALPLGERSVTSLGPVAAEELVDPHGGRADVAAGILRVLAPEAYESDPLRPLRLARLAAELGFSPDADTERLTAEAASRVAEASPERIFAELRRLLVAEHVLAGLELADRLGLVRAVLPELAELHNVEQSDFHHLDVYDHTLEVLARQIVLEGCLEEHFGELAPRLQAVLDQPLGDELTRGQAIRLGALLHDVGKPATRDVRGDGRVTFLGHDKAGEQITRSICRRLRTSERVSSFLEGLTLNHLVLGFLVHQRPLPPRAIYRYLQRTQPVEVEVTLLSCADRLATRGRGAERATRPHLKLARELMGFALEWRAAGPPKAPVRGDELARELGLEPGPELGRLLAELAEAAYAGEATTRDEALALARTLSR